MMQVFDILEYGVRGILLLYFYKDALIWKKNFARQGKYLFFLLFVVWELWLGNSKWLQRLLYGESMAPQKSSTSIVKLFLTIAVCFVLTLKRIPITIHDTNRALGYNPLYFARKLSIY